MNKYIASIAFLLVTIISYKAGAQSYPDKLHLKDGSIFYGKIIETDNTETVRIEIIGNNILSFNKSEVLKIEPNTEKNHKKLSFGSSLQFFGGSSNNAGIAFSVSYPVVQRLHAGLGSGLEFFDYQILPMYAEFKYDILPGRLTPFLYCRAGYSLPLSKGTNNGWYTPTYTGGMLFAAGAGIQRSFSSSGSFFFAVGYRYQRLRSISNSYLWYSGDNIQESVFIEGKNRINVSLGVLF
jgi:hypothetical protein